VRLKNELRVLATRRSSTRFLLTAWTTIILRQGGATLARPFSYPVVDAREKIRAQQTDHLPCIEAVILVACVRQRIFNGSRTNTSLSYGFSRSYSRAAQIPSSKVLCKSPHNPRTNSTIVMALVSMIGSITSLPSKSKTPFEIVHL
jgi:hypothetical protein